MKKQELRKRLFELRDEKYKDFTKMLTPGENKIIGVRMPLLKELAKEIALSDFRSFLKDAYMDYHEERLIYGLILGFVKIELDELFFYLDKWLLYINNWAVCDTVTMNLKIFGKTKEKDKVWDYLIEKLKMQDKPFVIRAAVVCLFCYFLDSKYVDKVDKVFCQIKCQDYYVKMAVAWGVSTLLIKNFDAGLELLKSKKLEPWTHNKSIQKSLESFRLTSEQKEILRNLRL